MQTTLPPTAFAPEDLSGASKEEIYEYAKELKHEAAFLADEVLVKNQALTAMGNALQSARTSVDEARGALEEKEIKLRTAVEEIKQLRLALSDAAPRTAELEVLRSKLEEDLRAAQESLAEKTAKLDSVSKMEEENTTLKAENEKMAETMVDWKGKVKEALKENRRKEQLQEKTEIELRTQLSGLQEQLDKATFELQAFRAKESKVRSNIDTQTDAELLEPLLAPLVQEKLVEAMQQAGPMSPLQGRARSQSLAAVSTPPLPPRSQSRAPGDATPNANASTPAADGVEGITSPPPKKPPTAPATRFIIAVHFGSSEGWTVDTKHVVQPGMTVSELIRNCIGTINARYAQSLEETEMCLKMNHGKAKRVVTLADQRELHSFAIFHKYQREGQPITLTLDHKKDEPWDEYLSPRYSQEPAH